MGLCGEAGAAPTLPRGKSERASVLGMHWCFQTELGVVHLMCVLGAAAALPRGKLRWAYSLAGLHDDLHLCPGLFRSGHA